MPAITIRKLSEETHRALKARAARHGRSTEAEVRSILEEATHRTDQVGLGSLLADIGRSAGGVEFPTRDREAHQPIDLS